MVICGWPCWIARAHVLERVAGEDAHQHGAGGLAAARAADEQAAAPHGEVQQRQQHEAGIALPRRQRRPCSALSPNVNVWCGPSLYSMS